MISRLRIGKGERAGRHESNENREDSHPTMAYVLTSDAFSRGAISVRSFAERIEIDLSVIQAANTA